MTDLTHLSAAIARGRRACVLPLRGACEVTRDPRHNMRLYLFLSLSLYIYISYYYYYYYYIYIYIHILSLYILYIHMCVCIHIYIYISTYTYIHIYAHHSRLPQSAAAGLRRGTTLCARGLRASGTRCQPEQHVASPSELYVHGEVIVDGGHLHQAARRASPRNHRAWERKPKLTTHPQP